MLQGERLRALRLLALSDKEERVKAVVEDTVEFTIDTNGGPYPDVSAERVNQYLDVN